MFNFFKKKIKHTNFESLKIDFHSHILPGLDDGSDDLEESIELLRKMEGFGYTHLIMSPHVMGDFYNNTTELIFDRLQLLQEAAKSNNIQITLQATAEYYLDEWFEEKIKTKQLLPFAKNKILFEISYVNEPRNLFETIFDLQIAGYQPILAHPERYSFFHSRFDIYEKIAQTGCRLQVNLLSLIGYYGPSEKHIAEKLINNKLAYYLSSDAHKLKHLELLPNVFESELYHDAIKQSHHLELLSEL